MSSCILKIDPWRKSTKKECAKLNIMLSLPPCYFFIRPDILFFPSIPISSIQVLLKHCVGWLAGMQMHALPRVCLEKAWV